MLIDKVNWLKRKIKIFGSKFMARISSGMFDQPLIIVQSCIALQNNITCLPVGNQMDILIQI